MDQAQSLGLPPEQPSDNGAEEVARRAAAVVEGRRHERILKRENPVKR
jgi:hypothetical protein